MKSAMLSTLVLCALLAVSVAAPLLSIPWREGQQATIEQDSYTEEEGEFLEILEDAIASQNYKLPEDNRAEYLYPDEQSKSEANRVENKWNQNYQQYQAYDPGLHNEEEAPIPISPDVEKELLSFARHYVPLRHPGQWLPTPPPMAQQQNAKMQPLKAFDEQDSREALFNMMHQAEDWFPSDKVTDE